MWTGKQRNTQRTVTEDAPADLCKIHWGGSTAWVGPRKVISRGSTGCKGTCQSPFFRTYFCLSPDFAREPQEGEKSGPRYDGNDASAFFMQTLHSLLHSVRTERPALHDVQSCFSPVRASDHVSTEQAKICGLHSAIRGGSGEGLQGRIRGLVQGATRQPREDFIAPVKKKQGEICFWFSAGSSFVCPHTNKRA